ncbi:hypothetical protein SUGI_0716270 [Cryptomeria japonica]|uniref:protein ILITYHIA isoform X2 n=1 Tax=Cryptomeria japonica TaxID=3369 RepID=UPI00241480A9|nr:protein ILITYHIA isoform X2 [Cryptomeria japonica]GLJ35635.1 hypothetical protein SUGI_0716270 [Cryptomeria japonica]
MEVLQGASQEVYTSSTKQRIAVFRDSIIPLLDKLGEINIDCATLLVDVILKTLFIYDDRPSQVAVEDVISKALREPVFVKAFAGALVQSAEKHVKAGLNLACYKLFRWSCLLVRLSPSITTSKNAFTRIASVQASLLCVLLQPSIRLRRATKRVFIHLLSEVPSLFILYVGELQNATIKMEYSSGLIAVLLEYCANISPLFEEHRTGFRELYLKIVLNSRERPPKTLTEAFQPLFKHMGHEDFGKIVVPTSIKMLKRNPELSLEAVGVLLNLVNLDLSKYTGDFLPTVLQQARHNDENRRKEALEIIKNLSLQSSDPDAIVTMFNSVKGIIGGSEGKLAFPYQRVGMFNAIQALSNAPPGKALNTLATSASLFLISTYKEDGNEDVRLSLLSALGSWILRSTEGIVENAASFFISGLKEKEALRRGHLRSMRMACKNMEILIRMQPLVEPLLQIVKSGASKPAQRVEGIYALLLVVKIAAVNTKADDMLIKEKIWQLIFQSNSSLISTTVASKFAVDDCVAFMDLVEVLLLEHSQRVAESTQSKQLLQLALFFLCHPSWEVRRLASIAVKRVHSSVSKISEDLLSEFLEWLPVLGERLEFARTSDAENVTDSLLPMVPPEGVLVKALLVIAAPALAKIPSTCALLLLCSHHPCVTRGSRKNVVWKVLVRSIKKNGLDVTQTLATYPGVICEILLGPRGLMNSGCTESQAAIAALSTAMQIIPNEIYAEFIKRLEELSERGLHDGLTETDIKIFNTQEGVLSSEQGVYVAEVVTDKNIKQAKGRFKLYDDLENGEPVKSGSPIRQTSVKRETTNMGKKDIPKATKKLDGDKSKSAKEEARELQLKEEAAVRLMVKHIQEILSLMLRALGEIAIANPVFTHMKLPFLEDYVMPLLSSPIVNSDAFVTMEKFARCVAPPVRHLALDIAAALRTLATSKSSVVEELVLPSDTPNAQEKKVPGIFERIVAGLVTACKDGPLPADSFTFIFPILEQILLSPKKTKVHDDVLYIFSLHLDPVVPLPRLRMITVLYNVLGNMPAYQATVGPMLNELCLGIHASEVAQALGGIYLKHAHVRIACLKAIKCVPAVSKGAVPDNIDVITSIWIALHDPEKSVAEVAETLWERCAFDFGTDYSRLLAALSHVNFNVRQAAAEALAAAMDESPDTIPDTLSSLFSLYVQDTPSGRDTIDPSWPGRQGIALALNAAADILTTKDIPIVITFLISRALADCNMDVRGRMIDAGVIIIDKHGKDNISLLFPIFENYLNKKATDEETYDLVREGVVIFTGALAKHLATDDPKISIILEKLLEVLNTPSESVQRAVSNCLPPLMKSQQENAQVLVSRLLNQLTQSEKYGERRGAAFGLAGVVKGFGISSIKKYGIVDSLKAGLEDRNSAKAREGALFGFECLCERLGRLFEPYVIQILPLLLACFSDQVIAVRESADCAARAMMSQLSGQGVKLVLPSLLKGLEDKAWRTKQGSVQLLGAMAYCAPQQLSQCLPKIVPKLTEVLTDTHPKVQSAGQMALQQVGSVIKNPEISALVSTLLLGISDPNQHAKYSLDIILQTTFVNTIDAPALALLVPIVHRGLRERSADTKKKAAQIVGNMCSLVTEPKDMLPYIGLLLPEVKKVLVDPIPEVRAVAARAIGSLIMGMGEENFPDLVPWLLETVKSDNSNVERLGAAQGLSEVLAALGKEYFDSLFPDIIRNCSHQKAAVRDGHLTLFKFLPRSLGPMFQSYLPRVLPAILDGLADENESVRDAALSAGHVLVENYATTSLPLLLPAVEDGIYNDNWRIRQSSVELLGDLLFKVAGTSGKALLEGGSDDEGASTEAHGRAIIDVLGREKRNEVLAAVYMVRSDVSLTVRQTALHVWKTVVANTPKTLKEIMPVLMNTLITSLASTSSERRQVAGRSLGELVRKLGERVLPSIIPILAQGLKDSNASRRQGVCIGLSEVMGSAGRQQLMTFMGDLIPTIRTALCDSASEVREAAGLAFSTLYKSAGLQAIDEIVPTLLHALEDEETSDTALDGLKQILSVRTTAVLPHILPKLVHPPLSAFNAHALGALAEVAGPGLDSHLGTVLPPLIAAMDDCDEEVATMAKKASETVVMAIDEDGLDSLISELLKSLGDNQASVRRGSAYLTGFFFKNSKLDLIDESPNLVTTLIVMLTDPDSSTVQVSWEALGSVIGSLPKEILPTYVKIVRDAVSTARDKERRKRKGGPILIPGLCLPKALQPILPVFLQGLMSGSAELREQAAEGLGELIDVTSENALKPFVVPITGPLIRIIGDRFPWQVKSAILSTLGILISKGGIALKPFLPQLQTTFIKCLQDNTRIVRSSSALALGKLSALSTRVDTLVNDLLSNLQVASEGGVKEATLVALQGVLKYAGKSISGSVISRVIIVLKEFLRLDEDQIRVSSAKAIGTVSQYLEDGELSGLLAELSVPVPSESWAVRHGTILSLSSMFRLSAARICASEAFPTVVDCLKNKLKDDKVPVRESATKALGYLLSYEAQAHYSGPYGFSELLPFLVSCLRDDSSDVRRRALGSLKSVAKVDVTVAAAYLPTLGPVIAESLKDGSTPVRLAAERCALHVFQLTKGTENVQAAQKYITGLDARRIAKQPEISDGSEDSEDDVSTI